MFPLNPFLPTSIKIFPFISVSAVFREIRETRGNSGELLSLLQSDL